MEQFFFLIAGIFILTAALWFGTALLRVWRTPEKILKQWEQMDELEIERCSRLCEMFFLEELHLKLDKENLRASIPDLLKLFPEGRCRLKGYLLCGPSDRKNSLKAQFYRRGEYFYGFSTILLSSFIGESLRSCRNARWIPGPAGLRLRIPAPSPAEDLFISPVEKLMELNNISTIHEKELFEEYLFKICSRSYSKQN